MRALIQRVKEAGVSVNGACHNAIGHGLLIFLAVKNGDTLAEARYLADKCSCLRIFEDENGKMNLSVKDTDGSALVVSQFTLYADTSRGHRPSFTEAAQPDLAEYLYNSFIQFLRESLGENKVKSGVFRTLMEVNLINDGPVTLTIESK